MLKFLLLNAVINIAFLFLEIEINNNFIILILSGFEKSFLFCENFESSIFTL